jgi:hypothetical protein
MQLAQESSYTKAELEVYDKYWDAVHGCRMKLKG